MDKITKALKQARLNRLAQEEMSRNQYTHEPYVEKITDNDYRKAEADAISKFTPDSLTLEKNRILNEASREEVIQPYKVLRTRLLHILKEKNWSSVAIVSPTKDDGKTTVAINLSISIGQSMENTAVLLDLDLLTPSIHTYYGYEPVNGLESYYENELELRDILVSPNIQGLAIAPAIKSLHGSSEYLSTQKSRQLIDDAKSFSDRSVVIVDLPPMLVSDDAISFLPYVDAVLLVVREGVTSKVDVQRTLEMLTNSDIAGVVINDSLEPVKLGYY